ncbi:MAG: polyphenol oxidase family protein [Gemmatimonadota bacterium]|nr:polyphenol oxidase family protein [Gemmatimonadota bacterium]
MREETDARAGPFATLSLAGWPDGAPGIVAGITVRPADFGLAGPAGVAETAARFESLAAALGFPALAVARQVHGTRVLTVGPDGGGGLRIPGRADGLAADRPGLLLAVTVADCVPVYLADPGSGAIALLHAGWRGAAAGILARGLRALARLRGGAPADVHVHLGPSICGSCYEVGPEVLGRFGLCTDGPRGLDLRARLADEAVRCGADPARISISPRCTRCDRERLHSHRGSGGRAGRMAAFLGRLHG